MSKAAVFFDRDNTLIVNDDYLADPALVRLMPGAADAIAAARQLGFTILTFSNQSGVARGLFTEDDVRAVNRRMDDLLREENPQAIIERHYYCPFHPDGTIAQYAHESELRKPAPGMILLAARELNLDLTQSWAIGDATRDVEAGKAAGCRTILFRDATLPRSPAAMESSNVEPDYVATTLVDAVNFIARQTTSE